MIKQQTTPLFHLPLENILPKPAPLNHPSQATLPSSSSGFHISSSFLRNPSDKRSRKGSQTMLIRPVNIQRPRKASNLTIENDKTGIENKKNPLFPDGTSLAAEFSNCLPLKDQADQLSSDDDLKFQSRSRIRRKSDTSSWSGGASALQKKIGFLMFESILPRHLDELKQKEQAKANGSSKMRNILKRTLLARDGNRMEGRKEFKRFGSQRDVRGYLQKGSSMRDLSQPSMVKNLSKEEGNEGLEVLPETLGNIGKEENTKHAVRSQEQSENYIPTSSKIMKRKVKKNKTFLCKHQSISNDIKTTKEWILDQYISPARKGLPLEKKRPTTIFTGLPRHDLKITRKGISDGARSATQINSKSNLFEDMMQALHDSEPNNNFSVSEVGDDETNHLPTIEEEILKNRRRKKTNKSEKFFKDDLFKHKTAKSLAVISPLISPKPYFAPLLSPIQKDNKSVKRSAGEIVVPAGVRTNSFVFISPQNETKKDLKKETKKLGRIVRPSVAKVKEVQISYKAHSLNALHL